MVLVLCINVVLINPPNTEKHNLTMNFYFYLFTFIIIIIIIFFFGGGAFLESPDNFSGPKNCFMYAVCAFKTKVSTILKIIQ